MKRQLLVILALASSFFTSAQTEKTDWAYRNLKGKVKSVNEIVYEAKEKFGEVEKGAKTDRYYREFNNAGYEVEYIQENIDDGETEKFVRTTRYENNKPVEIKEVEEDDVELSRYKYNQQGVLESIDELDGKGRLLYRQKNKYNADGLLVQTDTYKGDGSQDMRTISTYNAKKQKTKTEYFDKDGQLTSVYDYVYDSRGNVIEESSINYKRKEKEPTVYKYVFNANGQKTEERNTISGLGRKEIFEYNEQGDVVRNLDEYGNETKTVYTYDRQNNWTKAVITKEERGTTSHEIKERQIKYY